MATRVGAGGAIRSVGRNDRPEPISLIAVGRWRGCDTPRKRREVLGVASDVTHRAVGRWHKRDLAPLNSSKRAALVAQVFPDWIGIFDERIIKDVEVLGPIDDRFSVSLGAPCRSGRRAEPSVDPEVGQRMAVGDQ
jgi:hypothetical protein